MQVLQACTLHRPPTQPFRACVRACVRKRGVARLKQHRKKEYHNAVDTPHPLERGLRSGCVPARLNGIMHRELRGKVEITEGR